VLASTFPAKAQFINGSFIKGCNLAWENGNYNTWLGLDPTQPTWGVTYNSGDLNSYMANMHNMGITVLRVWVNEGDMGDTVNGSDYVTGVTSTWSSNFANMVQLASNNGIALYVTLNNGRADWLNNPAQAASYLNNALIPLIKQYKGNSAIFAIDLMNEIDGVVGGPLGNYGSGPTWAQAQSYIKTFAAAIHSADPGRKVSCSTGWHQWNNLSNFKGLGLDFYDFHNYQDTPSFPSASSLGMDKPIYIGECGQGTQSWNDSIQNTCELDALNSAFSQGYAGVGIWDYAYAGSTEVFSMINPNGTNRPVCATIQNWKAGGGGGGSNLISNGTYTIVGQNSGMALDDPGSSTADGTKMDQWTVNGGNNQKWQLINEGNNVVELVNVASGKALDVPNNSTTAGTDIDQWDVNGGNNQRWTVVSKGGGYYELVNVNSGMALDVVGASKTAGALIDQWNVSGNANQLWKFQ
jgi:hypothetical protein